ncbi:MAG TPA: hypothetical protein VK171_14795 [Fimbriimonas sp.]|nr:hypothetical protein [Fimbriimonas sp.]
MQRREILTVWLLISSPIGLFFAYLALFAGAVFTPIRLPLTIAFAVTLVSLLCVSILLDEQHHGNWRDGARLLSLIFLLEGGCLLAISHLNPMASLVLGTASILAGLTLLAGSQGTRRRT